MIEQITVFLENDRGRLASICRSLGDAGISMSLLTVADTANYGVARIICGTPRRACEVLNEAGHRARITPVCAISIPDEPGGLATLFEVFDKAELNIEYAYCFKTSSGEAINVLRVDDERLLLDIAATAGFKVLKPEDVYPV